MNARALRIVLALWLSGTVAALGNSPTSGGAGPPKADADPVATTRRVLAEVDARSELMANLEFLCDRIGPRMTGSGQLKAAGAWARARFEAYGLKNAHLESWPIAHGWARGEASGRVVAPSVQRLAVEMAGWSRATEGAVRGPVVLAAGDEPADVTAYRGRLKGAWVLLDPYKPVLPEARLAALGLKAQPDAPDFTDASGYRAFRRAFDALMVEEGAAGVICDSGKPYGLIPMYGGCDTLYVGPEDSFEPTALPVALLSSESYGLLWRLQRHEPVEVELDLPATFTPGPVEVTNTVAELVGAERPEEVVILGAHLDSWDLAAGATDDGTGAMAVLEAARALKAAGARPRRTIRFVLFGGEEQGRHGSKHYVRAHAAELGRTSAVLVHDMGTGRIKALALHERSDPCPAMDRALAPLQKTLGLEAITRLVTVGSDHLTFREQGVPAFATVQDRGEYSLTHHSQIDTFDKVFPDEVNQGAKVLAAWAYTVAMLPDCLPRTPAPGKRPSYATAAPQPEASGPAPQPLDSRYRLLGK